MNDFEIIDLSPENIAEYGVCGYKDAKKNKGLANKIAWFTELYPKGLKIKILFSKTKGYQGMVEYLPGELAHRPVNADGFLFIQCLFAGLKIEFKGKGHASSLIAECIKEARNEKKSGVAVVTRKGSFMANDDIFLKMGFEIVDHAKPDFNLLVLKINPNSVNPNFKLEMQLNLSNYNNGLTIIRSPQCPYTEKNVDEIIETANKKYQLKTNLIELKDAASAQNSPCAFGTFCIIFNGEIISHHPISNTRFENIMNKLGECKFKNPKR